jgi:uncharacterized protein YegL
VLDTSTSVEQEFNKQLQFASDIIKHIPDNEFESARLEVGIVSFYAESKVELQLGSLQQKDAILKSISSIKHTGGSTFITKGMNKVFELFRTRNRRNNQLIVVLISDGKSQDEWRFVLETSSKLRLLDARVFALTASNQFSFRELEIYADKNVYTNEQFDQFLRNLDSSIFNDCPSFSPFLKFNDEEISKVLFFIISQFFRFRLLQQSNQETKKSLRFYFL